MKTKCSGTTTYEEIERDGFAVIRNVFGTTYIAAMREAVGKAVARSERRHLQDMTLKTAPNIPVGDLLAYPELQAFDYVVFNQQVLEVIRSVLGDRVVYFGDSSMQTGEGFRGYHKDCVHRNDPTGSDWKSRYDLVRIGLYLQDHSQHSGGLKVRVGSHRFANDRKGEGLNLSTNVGDLVIWKLTTTHSGNFVRPRLFPGLTLHPGIERRLPAALRMPEADVRMSIFCTFGVPGKHLNTYLNYIGTRKDFENHYAHSTFHNDAQKLAAARGVELRIPTAAFGRCATWS
jgi:hypothetical protein